MSIIPAALGRQKKEDYKFKARMGYKARKKEER
jgi:hypothetical protein